MDAAALTAYLHQHIPLTRALGARVESCGHGSAVVSAPLEPNLNHRNTAFGGSLATLAILSGWVVLHVALREAGIDARLVVQKHECEFQQPVTAAFTARSTLPPRDWEKFRAALQRRGRARISVVSELRSGDALVVQSTGTFVALT
ncbi:MAG TPA: YiiD C-terminal domain-containing protein [Nevskiaceae bacterium]|nr:YiiD C-terminal domain-containing protein [Nevskiaceae bacterium]